MTNKEIGPSFSDELATSNLFGLPFSWNSDGSFTFDASMTAAQVASVESVYAAHNPAVIPPAQQAQAAIFAGLTIVSASTPAINGTYPLDQSTQIAVGQIELFIQKNGVFPGSSGMSLVRYDVTSAPHVFPSVEVFSEFATAVANYVTDLDLCAAGAPGATLPAASIVIA